MDREVPLGTGSLDRGDLALKDQARELVSSAPTAIDA